MRAQARGRSTAQLNRRDLPTAFALEEPGFVYRYRKNGYQLAMWLGAWGYHVALSDASDKRLVGIRFYERVRDAQDGFVKIRFQLRNGDLKRQGYKL